jgi:hypothetical protein
MRRPRERGFSNRSRGGALVREVDCDVCDALDRYRSARHRDHSAVGHACEVLGGGASDHAGGAEVVPSEPGGSIMFGGPAVPDSFDAALREMASARAT